MQGLHSKSALFWAFEKTCVRQRLLLLSPCPGTRENSLVTYQFCPLSGPQEGRGEAATSDVFPLFGEAGECNGNIAILPSFGPPRRWGRGNHF